MEYYALTGLTTGQLHKLGLLVMQEIGSLVKAGGRKLPAVSVARLGGHGRHADWPQRNPGLPPRRISVAASPTVSPRWDLLRPVIGKVLAPYVPDPVQVLGREGTALVDGTVCPVWDWDAIPDLYSGKAKYTGMNVQIACNLKGGVAAIGPVPVHGARHDAHAFEASGLKEILQESIAPQAILAPTSATSESTASGSNHSSASAERNSWTGSVNSTPIFSKIRAAVEHAVAKVKTWRMLSREKAAATAARSTSSRACSQPSLARPRRIQ